MRTRSSTPLSGRRVALLAALALTAGLGTAAADEASAATISKQTSRSSGTLPVDFPGKLSKGDRIPRGWVLLSRSVSMRPGEKPVRVAMTCPGRLGLRNAIPADVEEIGFFVDDTSQYRKRVKRFVFVARPLPARFIEGDRATGTFFVLCGPRTGK